MSSGIIETIKQVALSVFEASNPVKLLFGTVTSIDPYKIQVGEYLTLTDEFLVINGELSVGDNVSLIRCQGGQKYVVLGLRTALIENEVYVKGGEAIPESGSASGKWQYPFKAGYRQTSPFGWRESTSSNHKGVDLVGTGNKHIYPVNGGTVVYAKHSNGSYGNHILINHGDNIWSLYAHLSQIYVSDNQRVNKNTILGVEGNTGNSFGSHLHLEIRKSKNGNQVDPVSFLNNN